MPLVGAVERRCASRGLPRRRARSRPLCVPSLDRSVRPTLAPASASARATWRPIPPAAPVRITVFPASSGSATSDYAGREGISENRWQIRVRIDAHAARQPDRDAAARRGAPRGVRLRLLARDPTGAHVDPAWCAIYETVTISGPDGELGPMLAESWRQDPERENVWRFRIRPGLQLPVGRAVRRRGRRRRASPARRPGRGADQRLLLAERRRRARRGRRGARRAPRAERRHAAAPSLLALGDPQPGGAAGGGRRVRPDDVRRDRPVQRSSSRSPARTSTSPAGTATAAPARAGRRTRGPAYLDGVRWIPILDDRERAAALERGEIDCLQNAVAARRRPARGEPGARGDRVPAVGARLHGPRPREPLGQGRPRPARDLARDRPAGARRPATSRGTAGRRPRRSRRTRSGTRPRSRRRSGSTRARHAQLLDAAGLRAGRRRRSARRSRRWS